MEFCERDQDQESKKLERPEHQAEIVIPSRLCAVVVKVAAWMAPLLDIGITQNSYSSQGKRGIAVPEGS